MAARAERMLRALRSGRRQFSVGRQLEEKWLTLPPVAASGTVAVKGERKGKGNELSSTPTTALKWIVRCCPSLPISLLHKLFRLRQVRLLSPPHTDMQHQTLKRVSLSSIHSFSFPLIPHIVLS